MAELSPEQRAAVESALAGWNVRVRAVPGAGKTFTCVRLAEALEAQGQRVLQLTYTCALKNEWREKRDVRAGFWAPHSFHSFALALYRTMGLDGALPRTDRAVRAMLATPPHPLAREHVADVLVVDEAQDCTPLYARLLSWYRRACGATFRMVVVGQEDQAVFAEGRGGNCPPDERADLKFLLDDDAFADLLTDSAWRECPFTQSFRLTPTTAAAVNSLFGTHIVGCNTREPSRRPIWACVDMWNHNDAAMFIAPFIEQYGAENVQLVAPSWKEESNGHPKNIRNKLSAMGYKFEPSTADADVQRGKTTYYTCQVSKGTEALCTILIGADSFAWWVNRPSKFVAMTRAREQLVVLQDASNAPWMVAASPQEMADHGFEVVMRTAFKPETKDPSPCVASVTDLLRSEGVLAPLMDTFCTWRTERAAGAPLEMPKTVRFGQHAEALPRLQGIAIPFLFAVRAYHTTPRFDAIFRCIVVSTKNKGGHAIDEASRAMRLGGDELPARDELEAHMRTFVRVRSETHIARAVKEHLLKHECYEYASRVITQEDYERTFPLSQLSVLAKIQRLPLAEWSAPQAAHAALAADAFGGDHWTLHQVTDHEWVTTNASTVDECHARLRAVLGALHPSRVEFEVSVGLCLEQAKTYGSAPFPVLGLAGRIDCVAHRDNEAEILEIKFAGELSEEMRVQVFLYMCLWAAQETPPGAATSERRVTATLHNMRTNETLRAELPAGTPAARVVEAALDLHFDRTSTAAAVLARFRSPAATASPKHDGEEDEGAEGEAMPLKEVPYAAGNIEVPPGGENPVAAIDQQLQERGATVSGGFKRPACGGSPAQPPRRSARLAQRADC